MPFDFSIVETIGFAVVGVFTLIGLAVSLIKCFTLNYKKSIAYFSCIVLSIIASFIVATVVSPILLKTALGVLSGSIEVEEGDVLAMVLNFMMSQSGSAEIVISILGALIAPILYLLSFIVFSIFFSIVYLILALTVFQTKVSKTKEDGEAKDLQEYKKEKKAANAKLRGVTIPMCILSGVLCLSSFFAPLGYYLNFVDDNAALINRFAPMATASTDVESKDNYRVVAYRYDTSNRLIAYAEPIDETETSDQTLKVSNPLFKFYELLMSPMMNEMTAIHTENGKASVKEFVSETVDIVIVVIDMMPEGEEDMLPAMPEMLTMIADKMKENPVLDDIVTTVVVEASSSWKDGSDFCGIPMPEIQNEELSMFVFSTIATATENDVKVSDFVEAAVVGVEIYQEVVATTEGGDNSGALGGFTADMFYTIAQKVGENELLNDLATNVVTEVATAWAEGSSFCGIEAPDLGLGEDATKAIFGALAGNAENNISISDSLQAVGNVVEVAIEVSKITDSENTETASLSGLLKKVTPESATVIKSLVTEDVLKGVIPNTDDVSLYIRIVHEVIDCVASSDMTQEQKEREVDAIDGIINMVFAWTQDGASFSEKECYDIATKLEAAPHFDAIIGEIVSDMATAWMKGESYCGIERPSIISEESDKNLFESIAACKSASAEIRAIGNLLTVSKVINGATEEGEIPSMTELVDTLTSDSADVIKSLINADVVRDIIDCDEATAGSYVSVIDIAFDTLLSDKYTQAEKHKEAEALDKIISLATDPDNFDAATFVGVAKDSNVLKDVLDTVTEGGKVCDPFNIATKLTDEDRQNVVDALAENGIDPDSKLYNDVMAIMTVKEA